jgi:putative intracellular protease/amidase
MDTAIPLFDGITALDAIGPYEVLSRDHRAGARSDVTRARTGA